VTFDSQQGSFGDNHSTRGSYLPAAQALDSSGDPSVQAFCSSAGAFLSPSGSGTASAYKPYTIERSKP
jgi:hypothetical protein